MSKSNITAPTGAFGYGCNDVSPPLLVKNTRPHFLGSHQVVGVVQPIGEIVFYRTQIPVAASACTIPLCTLSSKLNLAKVVTQNKNSCLSSDASYHHHHHQELRVVLAKDALPSQVVSHALIFLHPLLSTAPKSFSIRQRKGKAAQPAMVASLPQIYGHSIKRTNSVNFSHILSLLPPMTAFLPIGKRSFIFDRPRTKTAAWAETLVTTTTTRNSESYLQRMHCLHRLSATP